MKILVFSQYFYPEQFLINDILFKLVNNGHKITIITGLPNYPSGVIEKEYKKNPNKMDEIIEGVHVLRCKIIPRGKGKIQRLLNYFSYMILAWRKAKSIKETFDIVFLYQLTPIFQAKPAIKYCKRNNKKLMMYNCDLAPLSGEKQFGKLKPLYAWYKNFSKWAMNKCDLIAVTSKSFIEYNNEVNNVPFDKMVYLPQHASDDLLKYNYAKEKSNTICNFMFAGNIGTGLCISTIIHAAKIIKNFDFLIHIVGDGTELEFFKNEVNNNGLSQHFVFYGRISMEEMPNMYNKADGLLVILRKGQNTIPSKLQAYMAVGKPILGALDGSGNELIKETRCGKCVYAEDYIGLSKLMKDFIINPRNYNDCGKNGRDYFINNFTLDIYIERLEKLFNQLLIE